MSVSNATNSIKVYGVNSAGGERVNRDNDPIVLAYLLTRNANVAERAQPFSFKKDNSIAKKDADNEFSLWSWTARNQITLQRSEDFCFGLPFNTLRLKLNPQTKQIISVETTEETSIMTTSTGIPPKFAGLLTSAYYCFNPKVPVLLTTDTQAPSAPTSTSTSANAAASASNSVSNQADKVTSEFMKLVKKVVAGAESSTAPTPPPGTSSSESAYVSSSSVNNAGEASAKPPGGTTPPVSTVGSERASTTSTPAINAEDVGKLDAAKLPVPAIVFDFEPTVVQDDQLSPAQFRWLFSQFLEGRGLNFSIGYKKMWVNAFNGRSSPNMTLYNLKNDNDFFTVCLDREYNVTKTFHIRGESSDGYHIPDEKKGWVAHVYNSLVIELNKKKSSVQEEDVKFAEEGSLARGKSESDIGILISIHSYLCVEREVRYQSADGTPFVATFINESKFCIKNESTGKKLFVFFTNAGELDHFRANNLNGRTVPPGRNGWLAVAFKHISQD